jgi:ATP-dependent protease ClpP protease subunit
MIVILFLKLYSLLNLCFSYQTINLNKTNNIVIREPINSETTSKFIYDLNLIEKKNSTYVYLNTPGGSVFEGIKIIEEIKKHNMSCIVENAYSMGFVIFQVCKNRYILPNGKLMQHQMSFGLHDEKKRIENYIHFIDSVDKNLLELQTSRINISNEEFTQKTDNEWWLYGNESIKNNCADEIVNVECSRSLTRDTIIIENGNYKYTYSRCPLISNPIKKDKLKKKEFEFTFI